MHVECINLTDKRAPKLTAMDVTYMQYVVKMGKFNECNTIICIDMS
jgi:hypothetical protein